MQERSIDDLTPHKNARKICESRVQFFMLMPLEDIDPISINWKGEVVDGVQRLEALRRRAVLYVPCEVVTDENGPGGGLDMLDRR